MSWLFNNIWLEIANRLAPSRRFHNNFRIALYNLNMHSSLTSSNLEI